MEKISGILPSNARLSTVDLKNSGSVRGGMPSFGREVGISAAAQKQIDLEKDRAELATIRHKEQMGLRNKSLDPRAKIVQDMADGFFMNKAKRNEEAHENIDKIDLNLPESYDMKVDRPQIDEIAPASKAEDKFEVVDFKALTKNVDAEEESNEEDTAVGHYLDVQA